MRKAEGWIFECEIDAVIQIDKKEGIAITDVTRPMFTKKLLIGDGSGQCGCGKFCKPIKVELSIKEID